VDQLSRIRGNRENSVTHTVRRAGRAAAFFLRGSFGKMVHNAAKVDHPDLSSKITYTM
jgi:hypothetical protein